MAELRLTVTWNGESWGVSCDGVPPRGTTFSLIIPEEAKTAASSKKHGPLMFSMGTYLYFPVIPTKNGESAWLLWEQHKALTHPRVQNDPEKVLIPILLEENLHLRHDDSTRFASCRCTIGDRSFPSVNKAASGAVVDWTDRETDSVGAFQSVCFLHNGKRLRLDYMRKHVLAGEPLPSKEDADEGTPWLFGEEDA